MLVTLMIFLFKAEFLKMLKLFVCISPDTGFEHKYTKNMAMGNFADHFKHARYMLNSRKNIV